MQHGHNDAHKETHLDAKEHTHTEAQQPDAKVPLRLAPQASGQLEVEQCEDRANQNGRQCRFRNVIEVWTEVAQCQQYNNA